MFVHNYGGEAIRSTRYQKRCCVTSKQSRHLLCHTYCSLCSRQPCKLAEAFLSLWFVATQRCLASYDDVLAASLVKPTTHSLYYISQNLSSSLETAATKQGETLKVKTTPIGRLQLADKRERTNTVKPPSHQHFGLQLVAHLRKLGLPDALVLFIISSLPVLELRGAIPIGAWMGLSLVQVYCLCVLGNLLPVPLLLLGLKHKKVQKVFAPMLRRAERMKQQIANETFREMALALFVGIPLPGTGAWSGAIIAFLLNMSFWGATVSIAGGVLIAGLIMLIVTKMGTTGALIATAALLITGFSALWRIYRAWLQSTTTSCEAMTNNNSPTEE
ncbi:hypothetical protein GpartN1_g5650.t1 [Galdieria partita]|uniref:Small multidrug export protein n=1 Tax=Galdieria partita TaxID=83374 RepID=A0A9C7Q0A9_9RHOD|nr:hypothetical protein GpartN1_g5650.t1 [Galdieria partita]